jgi:hypothetical protein
MARNKILKERCMEIEGQLTLWDIEITKKPTPVTKTEEKFTKREVLVTKKANLFTENQEKVIEKYKENPGLHRIIQHCGGGIGIELLLGTEYKTIYVNREGKEEFEYNKKSSVLPMDKIIFYKKLLTTNAIQEEKLKILKETLKIKEVIRRKGDENILVVVEGKVISIIPKGWVLEFHDIQALYDEDEVEREDPSQDIEEIRRKIKVGDIVQAWYGKRIITGEICRVYGPGNVTLNIIFDNGTKHTAICRSCVRSLIKSA